MAEPYADVQLPLYYKAESNDELLPKPLQGPMKGTLNLKPKPHVSHTFGQKDRDVDKKKYEVLWGCGHLAADFRAPHRHKHGRCQLQPGLCTT